MSVWAIRESVHPPECNPCPPGSPRSPSCHHIRSSAPRCSSAARYRVREPASQPAQRVGKIHHYRQNLVGWAYFENDASDANTTVIQSKQMLYVHVFLHSWGFCRVILIGVIRSCFWNLTVYIMVSLKSKQVYLQIPVRSLESVSLLLLGMSGRNFRHTLLCFPRTGK